MTLTRRKPTHRPVWRRYSVQELELSRLWGSLVGLADSYPADTRQRRRLSLAARIVAQALASERKEDSR